MKEYAVIQALKTPFLEIIAWRAARLSDRRFRKSQKYPIPTPSEKRLKTPIVTIVFNQAYFADAVLKLGVVRIT